MVTSIYGVRMVVERASASILNPHARTLESTAVHTRQSSFDLYDLCSVRICLGDWNSGMCYAVYCV